LNFRTANVFVDMSGNENPEKSADARFFRHCPQSLC
jgi:hypothetical protein